MLVTDTNNYMVIATYTCTYLVASLIIDRYYAKYSKDFGRIGITISSYVYAYI